MSALNRLQNNQPAKSGSKSYNTFGLVLEVKTVHEDNGQLRITGKAQNANSYVKHGDDLVVTFRSDNANRSITNFDKANGKGWRKNEAAAAGTVITLESCYITDQKEGDARVVSARWLNTLRNVYKEEHEDRAALEGVLATAPRIVFDNPNPGPNEPPRYTLPVVGDKAWGRVKNDHGTFKRDFPAAEVVEKLKALPADAKVRVQIEVAEPKEAAKVGSKAELEAALRQQLSRGTDAISLIRVTDADGGSDVLTRAVHVGFKKEGDQYLPDVDKAISDLFSNNIFSGVTDTNALFDALQKGELVMESVPVYRLSFAGNASQDDNASYKMVTDVKQGRTQRYEMIFGDNGERYAQVILPGLVRNNGDSLANFQPINLIGDEHGTYGIGDFPTAFIAKSAKAAPAAVPLEDADPAQASKPSDIEHEFDAALERPAVEAAPAPGM